MPSRILREGILTSDRVNALSAGAEVFYRRLMSVVDDYGRFDGRPGLLRVSCFPLRVDTVREADISRWIAECVKAGLIALYAVGGKAYLEMLDFKQQVRAKSKYPPPDAGHPLDTSQADAKQVLSKCTADVHLGVVGDEVVGEGVFPSPSAPPAHSPSAATPPSGAKTDPTPTNTPTPAPDPKGSRLPSDWELPPAWAQWCSDNRPDLDPSLVADGFKDFWIGKPGKDGRKADWLATWRNWCRGQKPGNRQPGQQQESFV